MYHQVLYNAICIVYVGDEFLSHKEFVKAIKSRTARGLDKVTVENKSILVVF